MSAELSVSEYSKKCVVGIDWLLAEEECAFRQASLKGRKAMLELPTDFRSDAAPVVHATCAELAFLVSNDHHPFAKVFNRVDVSGIAKLKTDAFQGVFDVGDEDFVNPLAMCGKQLAVGKVCVEKVGDCQRIRIGFIDDVAPVLQDWHLVIVTFRQADELPSIPI